MTNDHNHSHDHDHAPEQGSGPDEQARFSVASADNSSHASGETANERVSDSMHDLMYPMESSTHLDEHNGDTGDMTPGAAHLWEDESYIEPLHASGRPGSATQSGVATQPGGYKGAPAQTSQPHQADEGVTSLMPANDIGPDIAPGLERVNEPAIAPAIEPAIEPAISPNPGPVPTAERDRVEGIDRGMPELMRRSAGGRGARIAMWLAFVLVVVLGGIWTAYRLVSRHQEEVRHERDAVAQAQPGGRTFGELAPDSRPAKAVPLAPASGANSGASLSGIAPLPVPVGPLASMPLQTVKPVQASRPPVRSWYDADLMVTGGEGSGLGSGVTAPANPQADAAGGSGATGMVAAGSSALSSSTSLSAALSPASLHETRAELFGNRDFLLAAGAKISCAGDTAFDSTLAGISTCTVTTNVYSDNGHVLLIERGSEVRTEYGALPAQGQRRVFVLSARIKTPNGVKVEIDSPAADALGRMGIDGDVDRHWGERIGAAFLLSFVKDSIGYLSSRNGSATGAVTFQNTQQTGNDMAGKVLSSTINIAPTISRNQGAGFTIVLARDVDFSGVYELKAE